MKIRLNHIGKRYSSQWIFRNVNWELNHGKCFSILGHNGSGKSTLLQIISGYVTPSEGSVEWVIPLGELDRDQLYKRVSICTPATQLHGEWTVTENINFHLRLKSIPMPTMDIIQAALLENHGNKKFRNLSSGMQQRLKLVLACCAESDLLLLDEPCSHLDNRGVQWYKNLLERSAKNKTVIIASNSNNDETFLCEESYQIKTDI